MNKILLRALALTLLLTGFAKSAELGDIRMLVPGAGRPRAAGAADSVKAGGVRIVNDLAGLPAASGGFIDLQPGEYIQGSNLTITGGNVFRVPAGVTVEWDGGDFTLSGSGSAVFLVLGNLFFHHTFSITNSGTGDIFQVNNASSAVGVEWSTLYPNSTGYGVHVINGFYLAMPSNAIFGGKAMLLENLTFGFSIATVLFSDVTVGLELSGTIPTAIVGPLRMLGSVASATYIKIDNSAVIADFSIFNSHITAGSGQTAVSVANAAATFDSQGFKSSNVSYDGVGTALSGISANNSQALLSANSGITNSAPGAFGYTATGATATTLSATPGTYVLIAGSLTDTASTQLMTLSTGGYINNSGRSLTCDAAFLNDGTTSAANGDYLVALFLDSVIRVDPPSFIRVTSSTLPTVAGRVRVTIPAGSRIDPYVTRTDAGGGTFTRVRGSLTLNNCN